MRKTPCILLENLIRQITIDHQIQNFL